MTPYIILSQPPLPTFWGATPPIIISITQYYAIFYTLQPYRVVSLSLFSVVCGFIVRSLPMMSSILLYSIPFLLLLIITIPLPIPTPYGIV